MMHGPINIRFVYQMFYAPVRTVITALNGAACISACLG